MRILGVVVRKRVSGLDEVRPIDIRIVVRSIREGAHWNEFIACWYYLGCRRRIGKQNRRAIHDRRRRFVPMLGFCTAT